MRLLLGLGTSVLGSAAAEPFERIRLPDCAVAWEVEVTSQSAQLRAVDKDCRRERVRDAPDDPITIGCLNNGVLVTHLAFDDPEAGFGWGDYPNRAQARFAADSGVGAEVAVVGGQGSQGFAAVHDPSLSRGMPMLDLEREAFDSLIRFLSGHFRDLSIAVDGRIGWDVRVTTLPGRQAVSEAAISEFVAGCRAMTR